MIRGRPALSTLVLLLAGAVLLLSMAVALGIGAVPVSLSTVLQVVVRRLGAEGLEVSLLEDQIVWQLRMPRVLGAAAIGASLACCGAVLQALTRNDLADPYLLGISSGAAVGAVTVIVLGVSVVGLVGSAAVAAAGFVGAWGALVLVLVLAAGPGGSLSPGRTVLAGVATAQVCAAYTSMVVIMAGDADAARRVLSWTLGSVAGLRWGTALTVSVVAVVSTVLFISVAGQLDALAFGESSARSLGIEVDRLRWLLMVVTALVTACLVAFSGAIGFVGLVVPHVVRFVTGPQHRLLLPLAALLGAVLLVWADTLARSWVQGQEIPIGVVTAIVGAPFFAYLLRRTPAAP